MPTPKLPIIVASAHTPDQSGGFIWAPATPLLREYIAKVHEADKESYSHTILVELSVKMPTVEQSEFGDVAQEITEWIDATILDLIETGQIGHIISRQARLT